MRIKTRNKVEVSFSMSGMTDIVFLLLLFFMITSTMIAPNSLKLLLPQQGKSNSNVAENVPEVLLQGTGIISMNGAKVNLEEMESLLKSQLSGRNNPTFKLVTSPDVTIKETVTIMNIAVKNNFTVVLIKE